MKNLVVYYTLSGNTEAVAKEISRLTGGRLKKVEMVKEPKGSGYAWAAFASIMGLKGKIKPIDIQKNDYDNVFIGGQVWAGRCSTPLNSIINDLDCKDKNVYVFITQADNKEPSAVIRSISNRVERKGGNVADVIYFQSQMKSVLSQEELNKPLTDWLAKNNVLQNESI